jgi:hypothetical protein
MRDTMVERAEHLMERDFPPFANSSVLLHERRRRDLFPLRLRFGRWRCPHR